MRINLHTKGFDLTSHTRGFVESRLLSALGPVSVHIESVAVHLEASRGRTHPDAAVCLIVVSLYPSGEVRSRAEHFWLHVAINRAAVNVRGEVEREVMRNRQATASPPVVGDRRARWCAGVCARRPPNPAPSR